MKPSHRAPRTVHATVGVAALLLALVAPRAYAQEQKLDEFLHLLLESTSSADFAKLDGVIGIEPEATHALVQVLVHVTPGTPVSLLESDCACGLQPSDPSPAPPIDPQNPTAPRFDVIPATIPFMLVGDPAGNRDPGQPMLQLASLSYVAYVSAATVDTFENDISTNNTGKYDGASPIFLGANAQILHQIGIDGRNVTVGVIDTGIDFRHQDFRIPGTNCTRIKFLWDQTNVVGRCSAPAPTRLQCQPGAGGNAFCAMQPVCTLSGASVYPCTMNVAGSLLCKLRTGNIGSTCAAAAGATCVATGNPGILPPGFRVGTEWNQADIDSALGCGGPTPVGPPNQVDVDSHGSHVAGSAAGNGRASGGAEPFRFEGMAPRADLVIVKTTFNNKDINDAVRYIFARAGGAPAVANLSLGGHYGPHDGTSPRDIDLDQLVGAGKIVVVAASNEGNDAIHADNRGRAAALNAAQTTSFQVKPNKGDVVIRIWHHKGDRYTVRVTGPGGAPLAQAIAGQSANGAAGTVQVDIENAQGDDVAAGVGGVGILVVITDPNNAIPQGGPGNFWTIQLTRTSNNVGGVAGDGIYDEWNTDENADFMKVAGNDGLPTNAYKIGEPGTAKRVITVASHNTKNTAAGGQTLGEISGFSSPGPTRDGRRKPDLSAPGNRIASSCSNNAGLCNGPNGGECDTQAVPDPCTTAMPANGVCTSICDADATHFFQQGTSQATPHVTGCVALLLQQDGTLTPETTLDALKGLIRTDAKSVQTRVDGNENGRWDAGEVTKIAGHWNADFGWGKLNCALKAEDYLLERDIFGGDGGFFSVRPGAVGGVEPGGANTAVKNDPDPGHLFVGDRFTNGLAIHKDVFSLVGNDDIDAFSFEIDPQTLVPEPRFSGLEFSVDAASVGLPGTAVNMLPPAGPTHQHPQGHIWISPWPFARFGQFVPRTNFDLYADFELGLIVPNDDVDAAEIENPLLTITEPGGVTTFPAFAAFPIRTPRPPAGIGLKSYFSLAPGSPTLAAMLALPSDVLTSIGNGNLPVNELPGSAKLHVLAPGFPGCSPPVCDDVDGFFIDHLGFLRYSLADDSPSLGMIGASAADVLQPGPMGPVVFIPAVDAGLDANVDEMDALDIELCRFTALDRFHLNNSGRINAGVYVEAATTAGSVVIGREVFADDGTLVAGHAIKVGSLSSLANLATDVPNVATGAVIRGVIDGAPALPMSLDLSQRTADTCTGPAVTVAAGQALTLKPDSYGRVRVQNGAVLMLEPGTYHFCELLISRGSIVEFLGDAPSRVSIATRFKIGPGSTLGPAVGTPAPFVEVGGRASVRLKGLSVLAHIRAPRAVVRLGRGLAFRGSLLAKRVSSDRSVELGCAPPVEVVP